ncbi:hypothetical protein EP47_12365 [Legionella norrlandica]|uniref:Type IV secretion protein IcmD n=1 Tax=Legionella norrlandica TaxID=1498499 RepID=A0A0A2SWL5_9GAMM|nr:hypothetical protein [Legionella norrlandica]KGP63819.1 hypothetical protein EP47_12365 [Legionella norrlandica]
MSRVLLLRRDLSVCILFLLLSGFSSIIHADEVTLVTKTDLGGVSSHITASLVSLTKFMTAGSYLAGIAFAIGAIIKFKQHKDNPTQIPIGTPIALIFIACMFLFLPSTLDVIGGTLFGPVGGDTPGPEGTVYMPES